MLVNPHPTLHPAALVNRALVLCGSAGPFVVMIYEMLRTDVLRFMALLTVFLMAFSQVRSARVFAHHCSCLPQVSRAHCGCHWHVCVQAFFVLLGDVGLGSFLQRIKVR
jgi:hypothetical protein